MVSSRKPEFNPFAVARLPRIIFGNGSLARLPEILSSYGKHLLLVTGKKSIRAGPHWAALESDLKQHGFSYHLQTVEGEPSPALIDDAVARLRTESIDAVVAIGGGSVMDAGKAIAGLLRLDNPVTDFLEGVGPELPYPGPAVPFIALPTTAGTGSEATKNAVLSVQDRNGYKKSFRHDLLVAEYAVVDPELLESCPPALVAANGMDAITQLIESYVSLRAGPFTDALAAHALAGITNSLVNWYEQDETLGPDARAHLAWGALASGITLAQVGLGSVHGLASPLGAFYPIPHGVVCGTLLADATRINIEAMQAREPENPALARYARVAELLTGKAFDSNDAAFAALLGLLDGLRASLQLPGLGRYGVTPAELPHIIKNSRGSSMRTNPIVLEDEEIRRILERTL